MFHVPEKYRITTGKYGSTSLIGNNGAFLIMEHKLKSPLRVIASDGMGWEHVSVSLQNRCPSWAEMCFVKDLFWDDMDTVIQYHPPKSDYINYHPYVLHLWRPIEQDIPRPPAIMVGPRS